VLELFGSMAPSSTAARTEDGNIVANVAPSSLPYENPK
jgi:hypothetical protein